MLSAITDSGDVGPEAVLAAAIVEALLLFLWGIGNEERGYQKELLEAEVAEDGARIDQQRAGRKRKKRSTGYNARVLNPGLKVMGVPFLHVQVPMLKMNEALSLYSNSIYIAS